MRMTGGVDIWPYKKGTKICELRIEVHLIILTSVNTQRAVPEIM